MCVILIGRITKAQHQTALRQNGDGFSLFTEKQGLIKQPTDKEVAKAIGDWGIWHYRIGTSGVKSTLNVHPFIICGGKYLLYHNGVLGSGKGELSDTHALAKTLYDVGLESAKTIISTLAGPTNRFAVVSIKDPHELYLYGKWEADEGIIMSHKLYSYNTVTTPIKNGYMYGGKYYGYDEE